MFRRTVFKVWPEVYRQRKYWEYEVLCTRKTRVDRKSLIRIYIYTIVFSSYLCTLRLLRLITVNRIRFHRSCFNQKKKLEHMTPPKSPFPRYDNAFIGRLKGKKLGRTRNRTWVPGNFSGGRRDESTPVHSESDVITATLYNLNYLKPLRQC